ncbi:protein ANTAGONIST OF LIKE HETEROCHROMATIN PROTEIN 1-like [Gigantopelta aegis]|uniref:protein ANTAGONIST OF LIKE HETEROCHROMATIN PROTEIN 1-like n=1 Tax=Gigantopelta aegis TaxID=1735272 RepID=UPI001B888A4C|nr:protein ANTAGONIST OF LIKE HETEROCHROMATIN PROTEIN 1-like [Gigantopelta aegis]
MASTAEYRTIAYLFGVGKSTVSESIHDVSEAIINVLMDEYLYFPKDDDLKEVINGFQKKWNFPNFAGAIDGYHIPIIGPQDSHGDYLNRKGWYSLILQGVCDHKYIFRDINIGWPGRVHDARVLANSELFFKGENSILFPHWLKTVSLPEKDVTIPIVLIGDPAYPLRHWILKPYSNLSSLSDEQKTFNYRLSSARMTIENSFGRLKGRWRCLQKRLDVDVQFACSVIAACVVLHNIRETHNQLYDENWDEKDPQDVTGEIENDRNLDAGEKSGVLIRKHITQAFANGF